jgi:hypothetical protein
MKLGRLAEVQMGYPFRSRLVPDLRGDLAVVQMKDIDDAHGLQTGSAIRISLPRLKAHHLLRAGDVLFRSRGRHNGTALVPPGLGRAVLAAPMLLIRPHGVLPDYLCWFINAPTTQAQLARMAEGSAVQMIRAEALKELDVALPLPGIQQQIVQTAALVERERRLMARIAAERHHGATHRLMQHALQARSKAPR